MSPLVPVTQADDVRLADYGHLREVSLRRLLDGVRHGRIAILDDIVDHTNVGAGFRAAAAMGVDAVLITPGCADPLYRRSVKVSMGTVFQVPWTRLESWPGDLQRLRERGFM